ncbi:MAG TPA: amidohydrolase [Novosphingobium sp.]|nr:amidohydrolase [Novosphingobium sp.]
MTDTAPTLMPPELTLRHCRLPEWQGLFDVALANGRIAAITPSEEAPPAGPLRDLGGWLLLPSLVNGHIHLDKTFLGAPWRSHVPGASIAARIAAEAQERSLVPLPLAARARHLAERSLAWGVTALRSHVDVDEAVGLAHVEALLALREELAGRIDIQLVAFPQGGLSGRVPALMDQALALGVEVVGGLDPAGIDGDIEAHLGTVFGLAEKHGRRVDIHLHDPGTLGAFELRRIAAHTRARGMAGQVAVSHAFALGMLAPEEAAATADALAEAGVAILTNGPGADAMPPLALLMDAGVRVFAGSDNVRDAWSPYGDGDMLRRASLIGYLADWREDEGLVAAYGLASNEARAALGLPPVALSPGMPADLIALPATDIPEAVADPPPARLVLRAGRVIAPAVQPI